MNICPDRLSSHIVSRGVVRGDLCETDNAWIESAVIDFHFDVSAAELAWLESGIEARDDADSDGFVCNDAPAVRGYASHGEAIFRCAARTSK